MRKRLSKGNNFNGGNKNFSWDSLENNSETEDLFAQIKLLLIIFAE